jgi:type II secretory pathway pseudopilin PulG
MSTPDTPEPQTSRKSARERDEPKRPKSTQGGDDVVTAAATATGIAGFGIATVLIALGVCACCCIGVIALLIALLVPAVMKVREAASQQLATNNLKQITLAFNNFHSDFKRLPFNGANGKISGTDYSKKALPASATSGSWAFQILPYIEQGPLYNSGPGPGTNSIGITTYMNPARGRPMFCNEGPWSDFFINVAINNGSNAPVFDSPDGRRTLNWLADGTSNTIFVGEGSLLTSDYSKSTTLPYSGTIWNGGTEGTGRGGPWQAPVLGKAPGVTILQRDPGSGPLNSPVSWGGPYPRGALMAMGDGMVRLFPYSMSGAGGFDAFLTPNNGDPAVFPDVPP